jgi:hypothetical protein
MDANPDSQQSNDSAGPSTTYDDDDEFNTDEGFLSFHAQ